jgi:hypothetical protein
MGRAALDWDCGWAAREAKMERLAVLAAVVLCCAIAAPAPSLAAEAAVSAKSELVARKSIAELEAEFTLRPDQLSASDRTGPRAAFMLKPFGALNAKWEALKALMQPGDELWTFESSSESWGDLAGRAGVALVRNGEIIERLVTMMN